MGIWGELKRKLIFFIKNVVFFIDFDVKYGPGQKKIWGWSKNFLIILNNVYVNNNVKF